MSEYWHNDVAWAQDLEQHYEEYIAECYDSIDNEEEDFETITGQPFCGCQTCATRETIMFLIPRIIDAYKAGIIVED